MEHFLELSTLVNERLDVLMPPVTTRPTRLHEAMRYSIFSGGKRFRPALFLTTAQSLDLNVEKYLSIACVFEMIHTYSLIHDDLPAFDNDDFRRGKPSNHKVFGEATAVLAGDALLTLAFQLLADQHETLPSEPLFAVMQEISRASGTVNALIGGQQLDIESEGKDVHEEIVDYIHQAKTGALITATVKSAGFFASLDVDSSARLAGYGRNVGLVFQITDDILDIEATSSRLGKTAGKDQKMKKATFPAIHGVEKSRKIAHELTDEAIHRISFLKEKGERLREIARFVLKRTY